MRRSTLAWFALLLPACALAAAAGGWKVVQHYPLGGNGGWDYLALIETYATATEIARQYHIPALVHVTDVTQPQGHSTSGSHERYKTPERLKFEEEFDCIRKLREWIIENHIATDPELVALEQEDYAVVEGIRKLAWEDYLAPILEERGQVMDMLDEIAGSSKRASELERIKERLAALPAPSRFAAMTAHSAASTTYAGTAPAIPLRDADRARSFAAAITAGLMTARANFSTRPRCRALRISAWRTSASYR